MKIWCLSLFITLVTGCASSLKTDFERDWKADPQRLKISANKDLLSYLARYMLDSEDRNQLTARLTDKYSSDDTLTQGIINYSGFKYFRDPTGMGIAASQAGIGLLSKVISSGSMKEISGIALPCDYSGEVILDSIFAWEVASKHSVSQLKKVATKFNMTITCEFGCDAERRIYRLTPNNPKIFDNYTYSPTGDIVVMTTWSKLKEVETPDLLEAKIRGFIPAWRTPAGNMWLTYFLSEPTLSKDNKIELKKNEDGLSYPVVGKILHGTELGRDLLRSYHDDGGYLYSGNDKLWPGYFAFKGTLYSYIMENDERFIEYKLIEIE